MKKIVFIIVFSLAIVGALTATICIFAQRITKELDLGEYISEIRYDTFTYQDDDLSIKANFIEKEQPLKCDGIKGEMGKVIELEICFTLNPEKVEVSFLDVSGELNYQAVENKFTLSCSHEGIESKNFDIVLTTSTQKTYTLTSVIDGEILSPREAIDCVLEYDASIINSLTDGTAFMGEIFVRLIFDEECYYYVGICNRAGEISAYLLNAKSGRVIATKT